VSAIAVSAVAGAVVLTGSRVPALLFLVPILYLARMALNAMDGLLAREHAMTSRTGAILNEIGDVVSDSLAYFPFAAVIPDAAWLVVAVVVLGLIGEVAALAGSDGSGRRNDGPLGKSDRALAFGAVALLAGSGLDSLAAPALILLSGLGFLTIWNRATGGQS
jgi:CDP-diacylglycerol--glycerol-3-phosphate 3-phosphatidyltransferase